MFAAGGVANSRQGHIENVGLVGWIRGETDLSDIPVKVGFVLFSQLWRDTHEGLACCDC
jgi:hypothetical protein